MQCALHATKIIGECCKQGSAWLAHAWKKEKNRQPALVQKFLKAELFWPFFVYTTHRHQIVAPARQPSPTVADRAYVIAMNALRCRCPHADWCAECHTAAKTYTILFMFVCDGENIAPWQTCLLLFLFKLLLHLLFNCVFVDVLIYFLPSRALAFRLCALPCT